MLVTLFAFTNPVLSGSASLLFLFPRATCGVQFALSGGVTVAELSNGTCMTTGVSAVVPRESLSLGTVLGSARGIGEHIVVLGIGALPTGPICVHTIPGNAQITRVRTFRT